MRFKNVNRNGDLYIGHWKAGQRCGYGVYTNRKNGSVYEGEWVDDKMEVFFFEIASCYGFLFLNP